ncbi:peptidoglycan-binding protein [Alkalicoccus urumqiensis]|uniref:Peptidoglycan-binding protein n=1 Tax=Alkalicoccus urumqiensis TaxID=1548213 RepID=A0A2P6MEJ2_ALKUR|nr:peptidoglycan-binding protein [Alkalicoccus urumqiensis]PRO64683.1 peptidoglycan-binding protein [Alkalicoccus urumqiensis]
MNKFRTLKSIKQLGITAAAAGAILFVGGTAAGAEENNSFGDDLLTEGTVSQDVVELEELLSGAGVFDGEVNSTYGADTSAAVRTYQESNGLMTDGIAGVQTLGALSELERGDSGYLVEELQSELADLGYYSFDVDGIFGPITEEAVVSFQQSQGLNGQSGIAGAETFAALLNPGQASAAQPAEAPAEEAAEPAQEEAPAEEPAEEPVEEPAQEEEVQAAETTEASEPAQEEPAPSNEVEGTTLNMEATAYTANCTGCTGVTYTGIDLNANPNQKVVAVDPDVIPLGSTVHVEGYGTAVAGDIGGAINGNRIDLYMQSQGEAVDFGRRNVQVTVID